jgi:hypothetical protein
MIMKQHGNRENILEKNGVGQPDGSTWCESTRCRQMVQVVLIHHFWNWWTTRCRGNGVGSPFLKPVDGIRKPDTREWC